MTALKDFLGAVANERDGFTIAVPERIDDDSLAVVVPILRTIKPPRQYTTLPEVQGDVKTKDTGSISRVTVRNGTNTQLLIRAGTIFAGKTQERASTQSVVVYPGMDADLDVRCVHATRPISAGEELTSGGITPLDLDVETHGKGYRAASQGMYWQSVQGYSAMCRHVGLSSAGQTQQAQQQAGWPGGSPPVSSGQGADDLFSTVRDVSTSLDEILKKVKRQENQVGLGLITDRGCRTVELFDVPASWKALHEDAVRRVGSDLARKDESKVFQYKPEFARNTVLAVLAQDYEVNTLWEHKPSNGEPESRVIGLTKDEWIGEAVEIGGNIVHLLLNKTKK